MTERRAYRIAGRVQGVGFRWWAREAATALGLRGLVRNEADGTVYLEAVGSADRLAALEARLAEGPRAARVTAVTPVEPGDADPPPGFEIAR